MPIYDYRCSACGHQVEVVHGIHEQGPAVCEACGGAMRKAPSTPAIHFRGSGWAKKDAQAAGKPEATAGAKAAAASTGDAGGSARDDSTGGVSESKPANGATASAGKPAPTGKRD